VFDNLKQLIVSELPVFDIKKFTLIPDSDGVKIEIPENADVENAEHVTHALLQYKVRNFLNIFTL
jgi:hypothetical protein